jgi:hypothetical protein
MRTLYCCGLWLLTLATVSLGASAQNQNMKQVKELVVGVTLDSNYARITDFLPVLRDAVVKAIPDRKKQIRAVALNVSPQDAAEVARTKGCDYLLQLSVVEVHGAAVDFSTRQFSQEISPDEARERRELQWVRIDYHLQSLKDDDVDVQDIDHVRYAEYPSGWNNMSFQTTVIHAVNRVAVFTLNNLPKK